MTMYIITFFGNNIICRIYQRRFFMKKTCSIFVIALILYLSVINIRPVYAGTLGETYNENSNNKIV